MLNPMMIGIVGNLRDCPTMGAGVYLLGCGYWSVAQQTEAMLWRKVKKLTLEDIDM